MDVESDLCKGLLCAAQLCLFLYVSHILSDTFGFPTLPCIAPCSHSIQLVSVNVRCASYCLLFKMLF